MAVSVMVLLQLEVAEGALEKNMGIPVVVVGLKADVLKGLEREYGFKDKQFDYLNAHIRYVARNIHFLSHTFMGSKLLHE